MILSELKLEALYWSNFPLQHPFDRDRLTKFLRAAYPMAVLLRDCEKTLKSIRNISKEEKSTLHLDDYSTLKIRRIYAQASTHFERVKNLDV